MTTEEPTYSYLANGTYIREIFGGYIELPRPTEITVVTTRPCVVCGETTDISVDLNAYLDWVDGMYIQDAFPTMEAADREHLMTGTHPSCWDELFA